MYFKAIKSLIILLAIATLLSLPYLAVYKTGDQASTASGSDKMLGQYSLGNVGQSLEMCLRQDIMACSTVDIICPDHSSIKELKYVGLGDKDKPSVCPVNLANSSAINLNLVKKCSIPKDTARKDYNQQQKNIYTKFAEQCLDKNKCKMEVYNDAMWAEPECKALLANRSKATPGTCSALDGSSTVTKST